jgi:hypothetical protein
MRKLKALIAWCKSLRSIVRTYRGDNDRIHQRIAELEKIVRDRTEVAVDVNQRYGASYVIVVGRYRNNDYIQTYVVPADEFEYLIERLKRESRYGQITKIDAAPGLKEVVQRQVGYKTR